MQHGFLRLLAATTMLIAVVGCSLCPHRCRRSHLCAPQSEEMPLPAVERANEETILQGLASDLQPAQPQEPVSAGDYRALPPQLCQCLAAKHAPLADGLDRQRQQLQKQQTGVCCGCRQKAAKQRAYQDALLLYSALELRDHAAGTALEWYYQLAGAEAKDDLLNTSLSRARDTLKRVERLKQLGIPLPSPIETYQRQLVELQLEQAQNQRTIEQLNTKLRLALGYDSSSRWRFAPIEDLGLMIDDSKTCFFNHQSSIINHQFVESAVQLGLAQRPQLLLLRSMIANLDRDTLGAARSFLLTVNPLLAMSAPGPGCKFILVLSKILHIQPGQQDELERVRAQLLEYLHERERTVEAEIREAVYEIGARREATLLAREASGRWQERIRDLEKQHAQGMPVFGELTRAYMDSYKARGEVVKEYLGLEIAAARLKQAQGILPAECGYTKRIDDLGLMIDD